MRLLFAPGIAIALAASLLLPARPASAAAPANLPPPKLLQLWVSTDKGLFITFSDEADGTLNLDGDYAAKKQSQFNGSAVALYDNGSLVIGRFKRVFRPPVRRSRKQQTF